MKTNYIHRLGNFTINFGPQYRRPDIILRRNYYGSFTPLPMPRDIKVLNDVHEVLTNPSLLAAKEELRLIDVYGFSLGTVLLVFYFNWLISIAHPQKHVRLGCWIVSLFFLITLNYMEWVIIKPLVDLIVIVGSNSLYWVFGSFGWWVFKFSAFRLLVLAYVTYICYKTSKLISSGTAGKLTLGLVYFYLCLYLCLDLSFLANKAFLIFVFFLWLGFIFWISCHAFGGYQKLKSTFYEPITRPHKSLTNENYQVVLSVIQKAICSFHERKKENSFYQRQMFYLSILLTWVDLFWKPIFFGIIVGDACNRGEISLLAFLLTLFLSGAVNFSFLYFLLLGFNALTFDNNWLKDFSNCWGGETLVLLGWNSPISKNMDLLKKVGTQIKVGTIYCSKRRL